MTSYTQIERKGKNCLFYKFTLMWRNWTLIIRKLLMYLPKKIKFYLEKHNDYDTTLTKYISAQHYNKVLELE